MSSVSDSTTMELIRVLFQVIGVLIIGATSEPMSLEYHFINEPMSWADAQSYCRVKHTDLATVRDRQDHGRMYGLLELTGANSSWIGLRKTETRRWRWSDGSGTLGSEYVGWDADEPNNEDGSSWCAEVRPSGAWNDVSCTDPNGFICYELNGTDLVRFLHYSSMVDWRSAQDMCRRNHFDLVTVGSHGITSAFKELVPTGYQAWIGLFSDAWEWSDGSDTSYRFWAEAGENEGSCAAIRIDGLMTTEDCKEARPFFCEGGLKTQKTLVKIALSTTADLQSKTYNFNVLQHLHKLLKANRVWDFKLRWRRSKDRKVFQRQQAPVTEKETTCEEVQA